MVLKMLLSIFLLLHDNCEFDARDMKCGKSAGLCNLTREYLQHSQTLLPGVLDKLCNCFTFSEYVLNQVGKSFK